ncbi:MAG TPA: hypothetical protein VMI94_22710 [Bryobacteraceae bacterium]|nr:hypothetical protein [Bryobacteraceae bacterium]
MRMAAALLLGAVTLAGARAAELRPETIQAFDRYIRDVETRVNQRVQPGGPFLWTGEDARRAAQVRAGQVAIEHRGGDTIPVPHGLIHDWVGSVFIPGTTLARTLALVQDYDRNHDHYQPEVMASRLVSRDGDDYKVYLRLMKKKVITVILDTEYDVRYFPLDANRCYSRAYSTRIAEVENAGKADERVLPPGQDHGFLWRLDTYWRFEERGGGVYVECEAISLTRSIPAGLGWLIEPIIRSLPRESLENTLRQTRAALRVGDSQSR